MATVFDLVDSEAFTQFLEDPNRDDEQTSSKVSISQLPGPSGSVPGPDKGDAKYNYCPDCDVPMVMSVNEYSCAKCGRTVEWQTEGRNIVPRNVCRWRFYGV